MAEEEKKSLVDTLISTTNIGPEDEESYERTKEGLSAFINSLVQEERTEEKVTPSLVDDMVRQIDSKISAQMDEILHNEEFQEVESTWRSLKFLVDRTDFRENNRIHILSVQKKELLDDFEDAPEIPKSGLYKTVYTGEYGQFGGEPYGVMMANYEFGPGPQDIELLQNLASLGAMAHAPFLAAASPAFFNLDSFKGLPNLKDLSAIFEMPQYAKWNSFRQYEDARYIGLTLPHFLLRLPYGEDTVPTETFNYNEDVSEGDTSFLWGNAAFAMATRITESFAKYRWAVNIIGPQGGGAVENLPLYTYKEGGEYKNKIPTEVLVSERREYELAEQGFIPLSMRKGSDNAAFFSANSIQKPKVFPDTPEGKEAELNYKLGLQLPYLFVVSRMAHYIKVLQREQLGTFKERSDLEADLNQWISQYIVDMENPVAEVRAKKPLRGAQITVESVPGEPGWYKSTLLVRPHFKYMGAHFTLSLVGSLEAA